MIGAYIRKAAWWTFVAMACLALWRGLPQNPADLYDWARVQEVSIKAWYKETVAGITDDLENGRFTDGEIETGAGGGSGSGTDSGGSEGGPEANSGGSAGEYALPESFAGDRGATEGALGEVNEADASSVSYDRDEWNHWVSAGASCWNVREEVLYRDAQPGTIKLVDADDKPTTNKDKACKVTGGAWNDPYTGVVITDPSSIDIDHLVPLGEAAKSGGQSWDAERKEAYANNLDDPTHLVAVSASANRAKGDKDPAVWMPPNESAWCGYATNWTRVKASWGLSMDTAEKDAVRSALDRC